MPEGDDLSELRELLLTAGVATVGELVQHRERPHPNTYLGPGKVDELKTALERADANVVACDDELSPRQERNLEEALGVPVIDRTAVILDIFADHAHSAEGKLQVELAQLEYNLARMRGLWTHLERLGAGRIDGGIGTRGPGETQIETDRRLARDRITALRRKLERVERVARRDARRARARRPAPDRARRLHERRQVDAAQRPRRLRHRGARPPLPHARPDDAHGAPRRPRVPDDRHRRVHPQAPASARRRVRRDAGGDARRRPDHPRGRRVGARGRAARDGRARSRTCSRRSARGDVTRLLALNKADLLDAERRRELGFRHPDGVLVSGTTGEGLDVLGERVQEAFARTLRDVELLVPYDEGRRLAELHELADGLEREETADGVRVTRAGARRRWRRATSASRSTAGA